MNTIINYVETMFINLPETFEMRQLKTDILANMEDKYNELKVQGMTENEAVGQVISEFGNIDEVLEEMEYASEEKNEEVTEQFPVIDLGGALEIVEAKRKIGLEVGIGVIACCIGMAIMMWFQALNHLAIGTVGLLLAAAVGTGFFIVAGMQNNRYDYLEKPFVITGQTRQVIEEKKKAFEKTFIFSMVAGVSICIIALLPVIFFSLSENNDTLVEKSLSAGFIIASAGVFLFIYSGLIQGTYNTLLSKALLKQPTEAELKKVKRNQKIDSIFWPIVTVIFFVWGFFLPGGFAASWIVFAVGGILSEIWEN